MGCERCRALAAILLKSLNLVHIFIGATMILYSVWMLIHCQTELHPHSPPTRIAPVPSSNVTDSAQEMISSGSASVGVDFYVHDLLPVWFIFTFLGTGMNLCLVGCIGRIGTQTMNGCVLRICSVFVSSLLLLEAALEVEILFNRHWKKDIPQDQTGKFLIIREFIEANIDICKWIGLGLVIIQALSLLLVLILRESTRVPADYDSGSDIEENYIPALIIFIGDSHPSYHRHPQSSSADVWSRRWMRETINFVYEEIRAWRSTGRLLPIRHDFMRQFLPLY